MINQVKNSNTPLILSGLSLALPIVWTFITLLFVSDNSFFGSVTWELMVFIMAIIIAIAALVVNKNNSKHHKLVMVLAIISLVIYSTLSLAEIILGYGSVA